MADDGGMGAALAQLEQDSRRPLLVRAYDASSWMYSLTGLAYLASLPKLPARGRPLPGVSGRAFGTILTLQGALSYSNDVWAPRAAHSGEVLGAEARSAVAWADRLL